MGAARFDHRALARHRLHAGGLQRLEPDVLQRDPGQERAGLLRPAPLLLLPRRRLYRDLRLSQLSPADAPDALAHLAHPPVPGRLARRAGLLPARARAPRHRQPRPAHPGGPAVVHRRHAHLRARSPARDGHRRLVHRHPLERVEHAAADHRRRRPLGARVSRLGRARLCGGRERADLLRRPAAHQAQLPAGAARGRFPLRARPPARERGGRRALPRRGGGEPGFHEPRSSGSARTGGA